MKTFEFRVSGEISRWIAVEAETISEAEDKILEDIENGENCFDALRAGDIYPVDIEHGNALKSKKDVGDYSYFYKAEEA